ncbi:MAG TPA: hypothetical protein VNS09_25165 [Solirubrobacter sp.]|nr:hypothetical protein [Solirubrobacter sp.]
MFRSWKGVVAVAVAMAVVPAGTALAAPAITVTTPQQGEEFTVGQAVNASYSCADPSGTAPIASCTGTVANGAPINTAAEGTFTFHVEAVDGAGGTASVDRTYTVVPVTGPVGGDTPATLILTLGPAAAFAPFTPALARDYTATTTATMTSTAANATLSVADASPVATGHLVNGAFALSSPLSASASPSAGSGGVAAAGGPVGGSANPTELVTYDGPLGSEVATLTFKQPISGTEPLRTGAYGKTLTFTLSTTEP